MKFYNWKRFNESSLTDTDSEEDIHHICSRILVLKKYTVNEDGTIDVNGDVSLRGLSKIPVKFRKVTGNFICNYNKCPEKITFNFNCSNNQLTTLRGGPEEVGNYYNCHDNKLKDVEGFPELWKGSLSIAGNPVFKIIKLFPEEKWSKAIYLINEYRAIDSKRVNSYVLEEIFLELGLTPPQIKYIKGYEIA